MAEVWGSQPPAGWLVSRLEVVSAGGWDRTLAGAFDAVANADGLAVTVVFALVFAFAWVGGVFEVGHCELLWKQAVVNSTIEESWAD